MVISADEKKILLERLQKARETKAAKAAATKAAKAKEAEPPAPAPAPVPVPAPAPAPAPEAPIVAILEKPPASEPIDIPQVPDLVAMSKKPAKKKKVSLPSSDESDSSDSEAELPAKVGKGKSGKKQAYMKIKIYKEPKNTAAFQSLVEAIQDEQEPEPSVGEVSPPASASIERGRKFDIKNKTPSQSRTLPTPQELMRRAALEFFS